MMATRVTATPGQELEFILVREGIVVDTLVLNTSEHPHPGKSVRDHWHGNEGMIYTRLRGLSYSDTTSKA